jgi:hypothetical protein
VSDGEAACCHNGNEGGVEHGIIQLEEAVVHYMLVAYLKNAVSSPDCIVANNGMVNK